MDACVPAAEQFDTFFVPRSVHLSGFIEETAKKLFHAWDTNCSAAGTNFSTTDRDPHDDAQDYSITSA